MSEETIWRRHAARSDAQMKSFATLWKDTGDGYFLQLAIECRNQRNIEKFLAEKARMSRVAENLLTMIGL